MLSTLDTPHLESASLASATQATASALRQLIVVGSFPPSGGLKYAFVVNFSHDGHAGL